MDEDVGEWAENGNMTCVCVCVRDEVSQMMND